MNWTFWIGVALIGASIPRCERLQSKWYGRYLDLFLAADGAFLIGHNLPF